MEEQSYWQVAAGDKQRDYSKYFFDYGIACVGKNDVISKVKPGHIIILKNGIKRIKAIGEITSECEKSADEEDCYLDFDGWILTYYCHVEWYVPDEGDVEVEGLTPGQFIGVNDQRVKACVERIKRMRTRINPIHSLKELQHVIKLSDKELLKFLVQEGLRPAAAEDLTRTLARIRLLVDYYYDQKEKFLWEDIPEHETRTFLIIPFLFALGWTEQQLKIELSCKNGRIDIACFSQPFTSKRDKKGVYSFNKDAVTLLIETKGFAQGLDYAPDQARKYTGDDGNEFENCQALVVSNGYCYKAYKRERDGKFSEEPFAYLNLRRPTEKYPLDSKVEGSKEMLKLLLPR